LDLTYIWFNVLVVWLYPIQFCVELTLVGCPLNLCMSMQRHPYTIEEVPSISAPFLGVIENSPSPFVVFPQSPN
jgi:hypothetical protein